MGLFKFFKKKDEDKNEELNEGLQPELDTEELPEDSENIATDEIVVTDEETTTEMSEESPMSFEETTGLTAEEVAQIKVNDDFEKEEKEKAQAAKTVSGDLDEPADILGGEPTEGLVNNEESAEEVVTETTEVSEDPDEKMTKGLKKTRRSFSQFFNELMANFRTVDEDFFEDLEETLITADVGYETAMRITDDLRQEVKLQNAKKSEDVQRVIIDKLVEVYEENGKDENNELNIQPNGLTVMLFVGVNGVGKTTSIGKLANQYRESGKKVLLAAADTFRAGAIDQLVVWGERAQVEVIRGEAGGDPAAVVFDAVSQAKAQNADILLVDTAGRLQNKVNLMKELEKIKRVIQREIPDAPHEVMLVLDATTGQNAMVQAKQFKEVTDVTGLVLSKLDGTAKGGIVLAIRNELQIPVKLVGLGEGINDLQPFKPESYVAGLFKGLMD